MRKRNDLFECFVSGAKFGMVVALAVLVVRHITAP